MFHLLARSSLFMTASFCALFAFLRLWPYTDHDLRLLVAPPACAAPCFMGIQPGLTTPDEAVTLLRQHDWVDAESVRRTSGGEVVWGWSGQQPPVINPTELPLLIVWASAREQQVVNGIQLPLRLSVGHAFVELGEPPLLGVGQINELDRVSVIAIYEHFALEIWSRVACPITRRKFLEAPLNLFWITIPEKLTAAQAAGGKLSC